MPVNCNWKNIFILNNQINNLSPANHTIMQVDINCDLGEGMAHDADIMPFISSANIACGFHAGDENTMRQTILLAMENKVVIGAHISFPDKQNFGRTEMHFAKNELHDLIFQQLATIHKIADSLGAVIHHVKPHGALYNMSARDAELANTMAAAVKQFNPGFILYGLSGSHSINEAKRIGLQTASETFADRHYNDDGSLTARSQPNAMIEDEQKAVQQVLQMIIEGTVTTGTGKLIPVLAETICIHGDENNALAFARVISAALKKENIRIAPPASVIP